MHKCAICTKEMPQPDNDDERFGFPLEGGEEVGAYRLGSLLPAIERKNYYGLEKTLNPVRYRCNCLLLLPAPFPAATTYYPTGLWGMECQGSGLGSAWLLLLLLPVVVSQL